MKTSSGFTVVELLVLVIFLTVLGTVVFDRYQSIQMVHRDKDRKIAINAMYYNLEEVVWPETNGYPRTLRATQLRAMNKSLLVDPQGKIVGESDSDYRYEPTNCNGGDVCGGYTLRSNLELEADFIKTSARR